MTPIATRKAELLSRLADLKGRLHSIDEELDSHQARDWEDLATEREGDEVLENMGTAGKQEIRAIEAALKRIEEDGYGYCVKCGAEISQDRLDLIPWTPFCRNCAA